MPAVDNEHAASARLSLPGSLRVLSGHPMLRRAAHATLSRADDFLRVAGRYDILHRTYYSDPKPARRPTACTIVDMIPDLFPQHFGQDPHLAKRRVTEASDLILSISECTSRDIMAVYGTDRSKIVTTPLGIDAAQFISPPNAVNPFRPPYLLFVGQRGELQEFQPFGRGLAARS